MSDHFDTKNNADTDRPKWTPLNRSKELEETNAYRQEYLKSLS